MLEDAVSPELTAEDSISVRQLRVLWAAYVISSLGSAVSTGAIPLIAIERLHEPAGSVSVMTAFAFAATAVISLPLGPFIERQPKQRVLRVTETLSFAALASIIAAFAVGSLSYIQLCVVLMVVTVCSILYNSALTSKFVGPASLGRCTERWRAQRERRSARGCSASQARAEVGVWFEGWGTRVALAVISMLRRRAAMPL